MAKDVTTRVHSSEDYDTAVAASELLFGKGTEESLRKLSESQLLSIFEGVPQFNISKNELSAGIPIIDLLSEKTAVFPSKGEAREMIQGNGVSINKTKATGIDMVINSDHLIAEKYILAQKGKKNYFLLTVN